MLNCQVCRFTIFLSHSYQMSNSWKACLGICYFPECQCPYPVLFTSAIPFSLHKPAPWGCRGVYLSRCKHRKVFSSVLSKLYSRVHRSLSGQSPWEFVWDCFEHVDWVWRITGTPETGVLVNMMIWSEMKGRIFSHGLHEQRLVWRCEYFLIIAPKLRGRKCSLEPHFV